MDDQPVTKADLLAALAALKAEMIEAVAEAIRAVEERLTERIHDTETKLLTAFHGWARPAEIRMRSTLAVTQGFDERLALLEERVSRMERGDRGNPQ